MRNPHANRWNTFAYGETAAEAAAINIEAEEAEAMPVETCGNCEADAYYRPGVGAYQCPECKAMRITVRNPDGTLRRDDNGYIIEEWR